MAAPLPARRILHLDTDICVIDKPAGILSTPAPSRSGPDLRARVAATLQKQSEDARLFAVHRLDEDTTGSIVFARTHAAQRALEQTFRRHKAQRVYHALVLGTPKLRQAVIESRLDVDRDGFVRVVQRGGQIARTEYLVLARLDGFCLVCCRLDTGRRNQIRVQLAEIGCPLVGDRKYGRRRASVKARRSMLHASGLSFDHPTKDEAVEVLAPFPEDFERLIGRERLDEFRV